MIYYFFISMILFFLGSYVFFNGSFFIAQGIICLSSLFFVIPLVRFFKVGDDKIGNK